MADRILEIGCGTGFMLERIRKAFPNLDLQLEGVDSANEAISKAKERHSEGINFFSRDVFEFLSESKSQYSLIISMRCIQNVLSNQDYLFKLLYDSLEKNGSLILCEGTISGLGNLNQERKKLGLSPITVVSYNRYLNLDHILHRFSGLYEWNIKECCSTYMFITRVLYSYFEKKIQYDQHIHKYADSLCEFGNYGYYKLLLGQKISRNET